MTNPTPLSPAAQAVLDAWYAKLNPEPDGLTYLTHDPEREALAAALCAAADQVFPLERTPWGSRLIPILTSQESRDRLLAIATELENQ